MAKAKTRYTDRVPNTLLCLTHSAATVRFMAKFANNYDTLADSTMSWTSFANSQCRGVCCTYLILRSQYDGDTYFAEMSRSVDHNPFKLFSELPLHYLLMDSWFCPSSSPDPRSTETSRKSLRAMAHILHPTEPPFPSLTPYATDAIKPNSATKL